jgi:hypothetical protein
MYGVIMKRKRIAILGTIVALAALSGSGAVILWASGSRTHIETDSLIVDRRTMKKPLWVQGTVLDNKRVPIVGQSVHVEDDSGGQFATTDDRGRFSVMLGETEVRSIELQGIGSVSWGWLGFGGLDATRGVVLDITVKNPILPQAKSGTKPAP